MLKTIPIITISSSSNCSNISTNDSISKWVFKKARSLYLLFLSTMTLQEI